MTDEDYNGEKNHESGYTALVEDSRDWIRKKYVIETCPIAEECSESKNSLFRGANVWSYLSEGNCRMYLAHHLHCCSKHHKTKEHAMAVAAATHVNVVEETYAERQEYRDFLAKQRGAESRPPSEISKRRKKAPSGQTGDWGNSAPADNSWELHHWGGDAAHSWETAPPPAAPAPLSGDDIAAAVMQGMQAVLNPAPQPAEETALDGAEVEPPPRFTIAQGALELRRSVQGNHDGHIKIPVQRVKLIIDCLERADLAIQSFVGSAVEAARTARSCQSIIDENRQTLGQAMGRSKHR